MDETEMREIIDRKYGLDLVKFTDAVSLGLNDPQIAQTLGVTLADVKNIRRELGAAGWRARQELARQRLGLSMDKKTL
ncbi:MAG: hypothetical protein ACOX8W_10390 [bacterium]